MTVIRKQYVDTQAGQMHVRLLDAARHLKPPLVCLHPAPYSGSYFEPMMPLLYADRTVIAIDYPGYGNSYAPSSQPDIGDYANAVIATLDALSIDEHIDVLGFHTGCLVGVEMVLTDAARIHHLVLCDAPYFDADTQAELLRSSAQATTLGTSPESIEKAWKMTVTKRLGYVEPSRIFDLLGEHLRHGGDDHYAFNAAFRYPCEAKFSAVRSPTTVIATQSGLLDATREAAACIPDAALVEMPEIKRLVFDTGAERLAAALLEIL